MKVVKIVFLQVSLQHIHVFEIKEYFSIKKKVNQEVVFRGVTIRQKRIAIYCNTWQPYHNMYCNISPWDIITEKKTKQTQIFICILKVALQFLNKVSHDAVRGALKWFISLCDREVIQTIQEFWLMYYGTPTDV
jgi:hypothetical protein